MKTETIRCRALMVGDWCCDSHGFPMRVTNVGDDYAYATFEGNEGDPWEFDDKDNQPQPIALTPEILEKNGWLNFIDDLWLHEEVSFYIEKLNGRFQCYDINQIKLDSVNQLQQTLRLCGLNELADNFKI